MPRPEKVQAVADIKERIDGAQAVFLTEYAGLSVNEQQTLRRELKANGAEMKVVKMTLARLAAKDMTDELTELLLGPTSLTFADGDPAAAAKALKAFAKDHDVLIIKGGVLGSEFLSPERVSQLADLPSRDALLAGIAATLGAPMTQMAGLLAALPRNLASAIQQLLEKKEQESPESGVESPEPEAEAAPEDVADESTDQSTEEKAAEPAVEEESPQSSVDSPQPEKAEEESHESRDASPESEEPVDETPDPVEASAEELATGDSGLATDSHETTEQDEEATEDN